MRSRVRLKCSPTSSKVLGSPRSRPKRNFKISRSLSSRGASNLAISSGSNDVKVGESILGRVVDAFGNPIDDQLELSLNEK